MKSLCVIPARGGSKTVPGKNIKIVGGKPLIEYMIRAVVASRAFDRVILSTDSTEIAEVVKKRCSDIEIPFIRPARLSTDDVPVTAVIKHSVEFFEEEGYDLVFSVQPTNPLTRQATLNDMVRIMKQTSCDSVVTIAKILHFHPFRSYRYESDTLRILPLTQYTVETFQQKQDRPDAYGLTGGVLGRKARLLKDWTGKDMALGNDQRGYVVSEEEAFDLDTPFEMELLEGLLNLRKKRL